MAAHQGVLYNVGQVVTFLPIAAIGGTGCLAPGPQSDRLAADRHRSRGVADRRRTTVRMGGIPPGSSPAVRPGRRFSGVCVAHQLRDIAVGDLAVPWRALPGRWRWVLWAYVAVSGFLLVSEYVAVVSLMVANDVRIDASGGLAALDSHSGGTAWLSPVRAVIFPILIVFWLSFIARLLLSWRAVSIEQRQQLKWLLTGCVITLASGVLSIAPVPEAFQSAVDFISDLGFVALPVCVGIAILKYRLYDIDRIISRTLAYAIVTGVLIGLYAGLVLLATRGLSFRTPVAVAASTLSAAALFNPLRQRVQRIVDRRFNRARYDADQIVAAFAARLKGTVDLGSVRDDLAAVADQALQPVHVFVWTNERR